MLMLVQTGDGLLKCVGDSDDEVENDEANSLPFVDNISTPRTVGPTAAFTSQRHNIRDISVVNWKTELRNMIAGLRNSSSKGDAIFFTP